MSFKFFVGQAFEYTPVGEKSPSLQDCEADAGGRAGGRLKISHQK
jgi:hypothetical protein